MYIVLFQKTFVSRFWPRNYGKVWSFSFLWILSSSRDASVHSMNLTCKWIYAKFSKELPWSWFSLTRFWLRTLTHVNFNHVNKMEAGYKVSRLNVKLSEVLLFRLRAAFHTLPLFYLRNSFIDQTSSVKMVEYQPRCLAFLWTSICVAKKLRQYDPAILTEQARSVTNIS